MPVSMMPKAAREGVYRSARVLRTRSAFGSTLGRRRPSMSEILRDVTETGTIVNKNVLVISNRKLAVHGLV
jgi:hypothetical protein